MHPTVRSFDEYLTQVALQSTVEFQVHENFLPRFDEYLTQIALHSTELSC